MGRKRRRKQSRRESATPSKPLTPEMIQAIEGWAKEAAEVHGLLLWDVEFSAKGRWIVKVYVDQPGAEPGAGVSVSECADVSRYLETILDAEEEVPERYVLEVSSPGIERALKKIRHLDLVVGEEVELVLREPLLGKNKVIGRLLAHEDEVLTVELEGEEHAVEWDGVARAKLKFDF